MTRPKPHAFVFAALALTACAASSGQARVQSDLYTGFTLVDAEAELEAAQRAGFQFLEQFSSRVCSTGE